MSQPGSAQGRTPMRMRRARTSAGGGAAAPSARPTTGRRRIVWLASWPRSGNSWLRTLLANFLADAGAAVSFSEVSARIGSGLYGRSEFDDWTDVPSGCCTDEEADLLRPAVYRAYAAQSAHAGKVLFCRIHDAFLGNGAAEPLFPDDVTAGAIYLVRNPLDVAVSWAYYAGHGDVARSVAMLNDPRAALPGRGQPQLRQRLLDWSGHVRSWTGAPFPVLAVRYEDLLADTVGQLGRIARFLRLAGAAEAPRLRRAAAFSAFARLRGREECHGYGDLDPRSPHPFFRSGKAGDWRRHLSAAQVREIVGIHGETMAAFGYDPQEILREIAGHSRRYGGGNNGDGGAS